MKNIFLAAALLSWAALPLRAAPPLNDAFAERSIISGSTNTVVANSSMATSEEGEPSHAGNPAAASLWWTWVAPDSGIVVVDTSGSSFDTVLAIYTGTALDELTLIDSNDDAPGLPTSALVFPALRGTAYHIAVDGFAGASGDVSLTLRLPIAATAPVITSQPADWTIPDSAGSIVTFAVTVTGSFPLTFQWQKDGEIIEGATHSIYAIHNATSDDAGEYRVIVTNSAGSIASSPGILTVLTEASHDSFSDRILLAGQIATTADHNVGATTEEGEPIHAGVPSGASVWWSWTAPRNGLTRIDTAGSTTSSGEPLDTVLAAYVGASLNSLTLVAANNDETPGILVSSAIYFRAVAGATYQLAVAGIEQAGGTVQQGNISLNLEQAADNDHFDNALEFPPGATTVHDDISGATVEPGEPSHAGNPGGQSVWWFWVAPADGTYVLNTSGSSIDTVLGIYTGQTLDTLRVVAEDDNRGHAGASLVKFFALGGTVYHFVVDGFLEADDLGNVVLHLDLSLELNDDFSHRTTLAGQTNQVTASNVEASGEVDEPHHAGNAGGRSLWWTWTAPITAPVVISTRQSTFDTTLGVYTGTQLASLTLIAENDDGDHTPLAVSSSVRFLAMAGQTYQIAVDGYGASDGTVAQGDVVLSIVQADLEESGGNDHFVNRFSLMGDSNTVVGSNLSASKEPEEPNHASNPGGRSLWWSWVAPASNPVRIGTLGSTIPTILGVYRGNTVGALTPVAANDGSSTGGYAVTTFEAVEGVEYQIAVDGFNDGTGTGAGSLVLTVDQHPPGEWHAHDDFADAVPISDHFLTLHGLNIGASREAGEPHHGGTLQERSVWWTWTAHENGPVTISTAHSQFDTLLAVYIGDAVDALSLVAENDDVDPDHLQSSVTFQGVAGTTYRIAVDGYHNQIGLITLSVSPHGSSPSDPRIEYQPLDQTRFAGAAGGGSNVEFRVVATGSLPMSFQWYRDGLILEGETRDNLILPEATADDAGSYHVTISNEHGTITSSDAVLTWLDAPFNDDFADRILINGSSNLVHGSILNATLQQDEPRHGGKVGGRSVWWRWIAPEGGAVEIHTFGSSIDTLLAVYQGTDPSNLTLVSENNDLNEDIHSSRTVFTAEAGQEYQIAVDAVKTNTRDGSVLLSVRQGMPPWIAAHPPANSSVHVANSHFTLEVTALGLSELGYQWLKNGVVIANATNSSYALGSLSRGHSGSYSVVITGDLGSVTSAAAEVWVQVPQILQPPQYLPGGRVQLLFSDPNGNLSPDADRLEVQHTENLAGTETVWLATPGEIIRDNGSFIFEHETRSPSSRRIYRVVEK